MLRCVLLQVAHHTTRHFEHHHEDRTPPLLYIALLWLALIGCRTRDKTALYYWLILFPITFTPTEQRRAIQFRNQSGASASSNSHVLFSDWVVSGACRLTPIHIRSGAISFLRGPHQSEWRTPFRNVFISQ